MQICTGLRWRNAMFQKRRFRIVLSDSLNLPVLSLLCSWARHLDAHSKETSNLHVRATRVRAARSYESKKSIILTPCTSTQRKLKNDQRKNYRILISSCTDIRLFDFYSKRGLGPDQSQYNQSWVQFCCKMWGESWVWNRRSDVLCIPIPNLIYRGVLRATLITLCPCRWCTYWYT